MDHAGVGRVGRRPEKVRGQAARNLRAEAAIPDGLCLRLLDVLRRADVPILEVHLAVEKGERAKHAIAVEPVAILFITDTLSARAIAKKSSIEVLRYLPFNSLYPVTVFFVEIFKAANVAWRRF